MVVIVLILEVVQRENVKDRRRKIARHKAKKKCANAERKEDVEEELEEILKLSMEHTASSEPKKQMLKVRQTGSFLNKEKLN